jgi:hypothetical protein
MLDRTAVRPGWVWDYPTALRVARGLEKHRACWLEEPFDGYDLLGPARLAAEVEIPITGGELGNSLFHFLQFLRHKTYDIVQPDTRICGGIWIARKISVLAEAFGVPSNMATPVSAWPAGSRPGARCPTANGRRSSRTEPEEQWEPVKLLRTPHAFRVEQGTSYCLTCPASD